MSLPLIAVVGRPNVGKSSLFNRIVGRKKALIQNLPGITRDRHYEDADWDNVHFRIVDTGGLEFAAKTVIDKKIHEQALQGIEEAAVVVLVMDGRAGVTPLDREWMNKVRGIKKPKFFVINKIDSAREEALLNDFYELGIEEPLPISAETGRGVTDVLDKIMAHLKSVGTPSGVPSPEEVDPKLFNIALIGRPNAGKSTLLNQLLGKERAIVHDVAGTTRDPVHSYINVEGEEYCLIDTAGIRKRGAIDEAIEKFSVIKSIKSIEKADVCLLLLDSVEGITEQDAHVAGEAQKAGKAIILCVNKWDLGGNPENRKTVLADLERKIKFTAAYPVLFISAKTGAGVNKIFPTISRIRKKYEMWVDKEELHNLFLQMVTEHQLPTFSGKEISMKGAKQGRTKPPTFIVFTSKPDNIHFSYERFVANGFRKHFGLTEVPIRVIFRKS